MTEKLKQGICLLAINPILFFKYLRKFFIEKIVIGSAKFKFPENKLKKIGDVVFSFDFGFPEVDESYFRQIYFDLYELSTSRALKKFLKEGDTFIDIGANIGYITAMGANLVGKTGQIHSFEPIPLYFDHLKKIADANPDYNITINNCALGENVGTAKIDFAKPPHIGGSTLILNSLHSHIPVETIEVLVARFDQYAKEKGLEKISLIKIDTEGFEYPVFKGMQNYFENTIHRPVIICEFVPDAYARIGYTVEQLVEYMKKYGYEAYNVFNDRLKIDITKINKTTDIIWKSR